MQENLKKVCWVITNKCNQHCKFCFSFADEKDLSLNEHMKILNNLLEFGVNKITWSGGESLLIPHLMKLLNYANSKGVLNKINTNGQLLTSEALIELRGICGQINLSLNSLNPQSNKIMGKPQGNELLVLSRIPLVKMNGLRIAVNSVASGQNLNDFNELGDKLEEEGIDEWKIMKFTAMRHISKKNRDLFDIDYVRYQELYQGLQQKYPSMNIRAVTQKEFECNNLLVSPNGQIAITKDAEDYVLGNPLEKEVDVNDIYFNKN